MPTKYNLASPTRPLRFSLLLLGLVLALTLLPASPPAQAAVSSPKQCKGYVALTFDDGPNPVFTPQVLNHLARYPGATAVFFPNGVGIPRNASLIRRMQDEGHQVANHTWVHERMTDVYRRGGALAVVESVEKTFEAAKNAGAFPVRVYRPPYGASSDAVRAATKAAGWTETRWTIDPQDFKAGRTSRFLIDHIVAAVARQGDQANILLHDRLAATAGAVPGIIEGVWRLGYCFGHFDGNGRIVPPTPPQLTSGNSLCPEGKVCDTVALQDGGGRFHILSNPADLKVENSFYYGNPGDIAFSGDWNCDGVATLGLYRQRDGFVYLRNSNTQGVADITFYFGNPGDIPIVGDFDGDGCDTVSVYRPSNAAFYIINKLGRNGGGLGAADFSFVFGRPGDYPFVGDFDGDGRDTVGLYRPSSGLVYYRNDLKGGWADREFVYGRPGDIIFAGDWNGDGRDTVGAYRPSNGTVYLRNSNSAGNADAWARVGFYPGATVLPR